MDRNYGATRVDLGNEAVRPVVEGAKSPQEAIERLRKMAEERSAEILRGNRKIKLIVLLGSIARELSGDAPVGSVVWAGSDMDIVYWDESADFEEMKKDWRDDARHWLKGSFALYDPDGLLPVLKEECGKWSLAMRRKLVLNLWTQTLALKKSTLAFLEKDRNWAAALWSARKAYDLVLDVVLLLDDHVPGLPKSDWHELRPSIQKALENLHAVDAGNEEAVKAAIAEAEKIHWDLKEELEKFLGTPSIFELEWTHHRFPITKWFE